MGCHKLHIANCSELKISFRNKTLTSAKSEKKARSYYPFGMVMQHMQLADGQRFGFNGQEKETELNSSITSAEYWMYDGRLGRRWI